MKRMFTISAICVLGMLFVAGTAQAQKQAISAQAVLGFPMGDMADGYGVGFGLEGTYLHQLNPQVHLTGALGYKTFSGDGFDGSFSTVPLMAGIRYGFQGSGIKPYIAGALGLHFWSVSIDLQPFGDYSTSGTDFGFTPMFGVLIPAGNMMVDLTARYDLVFDSDSMGWLGINAGLLFSLD